MSLLNTIVTGRKKLPLNIMLYGVHGIGKTTLATQTPSPIFIGSEENDEIEAARFPKVESWGMLKEQLKALATEKHDFKTVVIDSLDMLQQVCEKVQIQEIVFVIVTWQQGE